MVVLPAHILLEEFEKIRSEVQEESATQDRSEANTFASTHTISPNGSQDRWNCVLTNMFDSGGWFIKGGVAFSADFQRDVDILASTSILLIVTSDFFYGFLSHYEVMAMDHWRIQQALVSPVLG